MLRERLLCEGLLPAMGDADDGEAIGDKGYGGAVRTSLFRKEVASEDRRHAQDGKEISLHRLTAQLCGLSFRQVALTRSGLL